jgi:FkbM family methyltransferase
VRIPFALHRRIPLIRRPFWQRDILAERVRALEGRPDAECAALDHPDQWYGGQTYAQHGDDLILLDIFNRLGIHKPSYLDVGAHHPFIISNTALLYKRGSRGINVEANPDLIGAFHEHRPEDINLNIGVAPTAGTMTFYIHGSHSGRNSFVRDAMRDCGFLGKMRISVVTIEDIVQEHANGEYPDLLSIDIEGLDHDVLASINYQRHPPKVICVESGVDKDDNSDAIRSLLTGVGYFPCWRAGVNIIFVRNEYRGILAP